MESSKRKFNMPYPVCPLTNPVIQDEIVQVKSNGFFLLNRGVHLSLDSFLACELGNNVRLVIFVGEIPLAPPTEFKLHKVNTRVANTKFKLHKVNTQVADTKFNTDYKKPEYKLTMAEVSMPKLDIPPLEKEADTPVAGIVAALAMALSVAQQVRQKKNEAESQKCCTDSKVRFSEYDNKLQRLDVKIEERTKEESKAIHAEMYEQYKELKELREDSEEVKNILTKVVNSIKG